MAKPIIAVILSICGLIADLCCTYNAEFKVKNLTTNTMEIIRACECMSPGDTIMVGSTKYVIIKPVE
jgi:hypothetical protein